MTDEQIGEVFSQLERAGLLDKRNDCFRKCADTLKDDLRRCEGTPFCILFAGIKFQQCVINCQVPKKIG